MTKVATDSVHARHHLRFNRLDADDDLVELDVATGAYFAGGTDNTASGINTEHGISRGGLEVSRGMGRGSTVNSRSMSRGGRGSGSGMCGPVGVEGCYMSMGMVTQEGPCWLLELDGPRGSYDARGSNAPRGTTQACELRGSKGGNSQGENHQNLHVDRICRRMRRRS